MIKTFTLTFLLLATSLIPFHALSQNDADTLQSHQKINRKMIIGKYEGNEVYCRLSVKIKRNHTVKIYRQCEANKPYKGRAKWEIKNDTIIVTGWFDSEPQKWILIKNCLSKSTNNNEKISAFACKDN